MKIWSRHELWSGHDLQSIVSMSLDGMQVVSKGPRTVYTIPASLYPGKVIKRRVSPALVALADQLLAVACKAPRISIIWDCALVSVKVWTNTQTASSANQDCGRDQDRAGLHVASPRPDLECLQVSIDPALKCVSSCTVLKDYRRLTGRKSRSHQVAHDQGASIYSYSLACRTISDQDSAAGRLLFTPKTSSHPEAPECLRLDTSVVSIALFACLLACLLAGVGSSGNSSSASSSSARFSMRSPPMQAVYRAIGIYYSHHHGMIPIKPVSWKVWVGVIYPTHRFEAA